MNIDDRPTGDRPQGAFTHCGKCQMAKTLQRVFRSPSCLVPEWGFRGRRHFCLDQIQDGARRPFWKTSNAVHRGQNVSGGQFVALWDFTL